MRKQLKLEHLIAGTNEPIKAVRLAFAKELEKQAQGLAWRTVDEIRKDLETKKNKKLLTSR